ncbi:MAG: polysaccharide polymerase [Clostridioides sp.]|jgi:hypothetical protein|nr:polysaccharide polymerase [Clostridioides sp.]
MVNSVKFNYNNKNTISGGIFREILFYITLIVIFVRRYSILILSEDSPVLSIMPKLFYLSAVLLLIIFLLKKNYNKFEIIFLAISGVLYVLTKEGSILFIALLASAISGIEDSKVTKIYMIITAVFVIACMIFSCFYPELTQAGAASYRLVDNQYVLRDTFGFGNPNTMYIVALPILTGYIFLRYDSYNWIDRIVLFATTIFIYIITMSRTGFMTMIFGLFFVEILKFCEKTSKKTLKKIILEVSKFTPLILTAISVLIAKIFASNVLFNKMLSSRPKFWNKYISENGSLFTLFGNKFDASIKSTFPLDSSYIYIVAVMGLIALVLFVVIYYFGIDIFVKENNYKYIAIAMIFLIYSFAENIIFEVAFNFTIIILIKHLIDIDKNRFSIKDLLSRR